MNKPKFIQLDQYSFVREDFADTFQKLALTSIDAVFDFNTGTELDKPNLAKHRSRIKFDPPDRQTTLFLKRYHRPPICRQLANWITHRKKIAASDLDKAPCEILSSASVNTPEVIAYGSQWGAIFEKRSFIITQKIPDAESLEKKLPHFFYNRSHLENVQEKRNFINNLADFAARFHKTGFRHRDFYLAHIFMDKNQTFHLIDLHRTFQPRLFSWRLRIKDITQLYYSAPGQIFSQADRLRFYNRYTGRKKLTLRDKLFIKMLKARAWRMADHDIRHGRNVPFAM